MKKLRSKQALPSKRLACSSGCVLSVFALLLVVYLHLLWSTTLSLQQQQQQTNSIPGNQNDVPDAPVQAHVKAQANDREGSKEEPPITIGFASTVTGCGTEPFTEGAAVLKHSIHLSSIHGTKGGRYDYKMYIIYHPDATNCTLPLADLGFELLRRDTPVNVSDIRGDVLRDRIHTNGCCGERELIKLEAFRLIDHPVVVLMDLDTLVMKPLDPAFDLMLNNDNSILLQQNQNKLIPKVNLMWPNITLPNPINVMWTKDYGMVAPKRKDKPTQGGLLILRPSVDVYNEFVEIVLEGDYRDRTGWGGKFGPFYGGMTWQGIIPYYYEHLHLEDGGGVELNRCVWNNMADNPQKEKTVNDIPQGPCMTNEEKCEDCRARPLEDIFTFHFTLCQKPWKCLPQKQDIIQMRLCRKTHHEWYKYRSLLEQSWGRNGTGSGTYEADHFFGYCSKKSFRGYQQIKLPYGKP